MSHFWIVRVDVDGRPGPRHLLSAKGVTVGRARHAGLHVPEVWVSTVQARLQVHGASVVAVNGTRTRMRVSSRRVKARAERGAAVLLQAGSSGPVVLSWPELDGRLEVHAQWQTGTAPSRPVAADRPAVRSPYVGTAAAANDLPIEPELRHRMAVLFQHLIDESEPPRNLYRNAAGPLGMTEESLKAAANRLMKRINDRRWDSIRGHDHARRRDDHVRPANDLNSVESLGYYLVRMTQVVTEQDLAGPDLGL